MATVVLIPGAGSGAWYWRLVADRLRHLGHEPVACDVPNDDDGAGFNDYADAVIDQLGHRGDGRDVVLVGHSLGAYTTALVAERVPVRLIVLVAPMVPAPGESAGQWWSNTGHDDVAVEQRELHGWDIFGDPQAAFLHDVPADLARQAAEQQHSQSGTVFEQPWPDRDWPAVPTRVLIGRHDRFFPPAFLRPVAQDRLGITPDEIDSGHLPMLAVPDDLAVRIDAYIRAAFDA